MNRLLYRNNKAFNKLIYGMSKIDILCFFEATTTNMLTTKLFCCICSIIRTLWAVEWSFVYMSFILYFSVFVKIRYLKEPTLANMQQQRKNKTNQNFPLVLVAKKAEVFFTIKKEIWFSCILFLFWCLIDGRFSLNIQIIYIFKLWR